MTRLLCPDGCKSRKTGEPEVFMNVQTLRFHLLHIGGRDDVHPERTQTQIDRLIFNPDLMPGNDKAASTKGKISIKKGSGEK